MTTNQEGVHAAVRNVTATAGTYLEDWHALFTANSVAAGPFNERMLSFLNTNLGTSYARLTDAMNAFAVSQGFAGWTDMNTFTLSEAAALLAAETQGLALVFTDDAFYGRDGFYGSAEIKDTGTPANNYSASPVKAASSLLTYTSPSPKLTMGPDGLYRYQAHNLYLNSAAPANQSITVVSGATYAVTITGSVSVTASGAATGTWTAGTNTFTAATTTLTLGSTSGSGTVHVRRTPSDPTYLATTSAARYDLPFEWDASGNLEGILVEESRTNLCLYSNDLTQSAWVKTNATAAKTATGPDGVSNSASTLTASANNGVALHNISITSASAARSGQAYIKRRTGTGAVTFSIGETTGSTLVTNGDFPTNITGWTLHNSATIAHTGSELQVTKGTASNGGAFQAITTVAGKIYRFQGQCVSATNGSGGTLAPRLRVSATTGGASDLVNIILSAGGGVIGGYFVATGTTTYISCAEIGSNSDGVSVWDDFAVFEAVESTVDLSSGNWVRASIENKTITNPCVAIKLATSGDAVDVAYADMETGAFITSPIETFGSSVTRAADSGLTMATSAYPHSATVNSAWIEYVPDNVAAAMVALRWDDGTSNEVVSIGHSAAAAIGLTVTDGGAAQTAPLTDGTATAGVTERIAVSWKANDFLLSDNGATAVADTSGTLPTVTSLDFGPTLTGLIKRIVVVPVEKTAAEVEAMATA